jgi:hypothetical protein
MTRFAFLVSIAALAASPQRFERLGAQQGVTWLKAEQARELSKLTGTPILLFVACDPVSGGAN